MGSPVARTRAVAMYTVKSKFRNNIGYFAREAQRVGPRSAHRVRRAQAPRSTWSPLHQSVNFCSAAPTALAASCPHIARGANHWNQVFRFSNLHLGTERRLQTHARWTSAMQFFSHLVRAGLILLSRLPDSYCFLTVLCYFADSPTLQMPTIWPDRTDHIFPAPTMGHAPT
jgi:hypothetical protein